MRNLRHLNDFDFASEALGALRIGALKADARNDAQKRATSENADAALLGQWIFDQVAHRLTGDKAVDEVCGGPLVATGAALRLSDDELEKFGEEYATRFFGTWKAGEAIDTLPRGLDRLVFQLRETKRIAVERFEKLRADANRFENEPVMKMMREAQRLRDLIDPPQLRTVREALKLNHKWADLQKIKSPFDDLRNQFHSISNLKSLFDGIYKPNSAVEKFNSMVIADATFNETLKQLTGTDSWRSSLEHARNAFAHQSGLENFARTQTAFRDMQRHWELPRQLVESVGALTALQEQVGRLTLPAIDWISAAELVRGLGPSGIEAQLAALGIDENGELTEDAGPGGEKRLLTPMQQDLLTLLSFIVGVLFFIYQERSSGQWQGSVDSKLDAHSSAFAQQAKQIESLSRLVERALAKEARLADTRFVTLERGAIVYKRSESGAPKKGRLLPREVVTLVSENANWIEVRYYDWSSREYATGWVLKKYFARVPTSREDDGE